MRVVRRYSLISSNDEKRISKLVGDGKAIAIKVEGIVLDSQFELDNGTVLLFLTDDSPYDEGLHIYLLSKDGLVEDAIEAGADFTPGILKTREGGEDWIEFEFFTNGTVYRLEVTNKPQFRFLLPAGWRYKNKLVKHRLVIHVASKTEGE